MSTQRLMAELALVLAAALPVFAGTQTLGGHVVDPQDRPVAGASIELACPHLDAVMRATSDAAGTFHFELAKAPAPRQACELIVEAAGFERHRKTLTSASDADVSLELPTIRSEIMVTSSMPELATERRLPGDRIGESGVADLAELFRDVGGMSAVRRGPINLEPTIRGLQEEQVAMFVDGTRTFAAGPGRMDSSISHVGTHATGSVRVIKGPYALAWGAGTLSALTVETFRPELQPWQGDAVGGFKWHGTAGFAYRDNADATDGHLGVWGASDRLRLYLGGGQRTGGDYQDGDGVVVPADYRSTETRWRLGLRPSAALLLEYSGGYQGQRDIDYPGRQLDATYFYARSHALELTWIGDGAVSEAYAQLYSNHKDHLMNNDEKPTARDMPGRVPPFAIEVALPTESDTEGGRFALRFDHGNTEWGVGTDYYRVEQSASRTISRRSNGFVLFQDIVWPDAEIEDLGGWSQVLWSGDGYSAGATVRFDAVDAGAGDPSPFFLANTTGSLDRSDRHFSAAVSSSLELGDHWSMTLGAGRAVRTPTVTERYSDRFPSTRFQLAAELMGNPQLDPEASLELDAGVRGALGGLLVEIETFYRRIDDYITAVPDPSLPKRLPGSPPVVFRYVNGSEATFYGGELRLRQRVNDRVAWRGSLSYVWGEDAALGEPVLGVAPLNGEAGLRWNVLGRRLWLDFATRFAGAQDRVAVSRFEQRTPGWTIYNLSAGFALPHGLALTAAVDNLTDHAYAEHLSSPNPFTGERIREMGRSVRLGLALEL